MFTTLAALMLLVTGPAKPQVQATSNVVLATRSFSMEDRYGNSFVNTVFKDNILLTMAYMDGSVKAKSDISWDKVTSPFKYEFTLEPGQEFAFHDGLLPAYSKNVVKTTGVHFNSDEGFKYDGDLVGDGVCHLASFINWVAKDAGLASYAPSNHNFAKINDVPKEYGVGILSPSPMGNLYITDNKDKPVTFVFNYDGTNLSVSVTQSSG